MYKLIIGLFGVPGLIMLFASLSLTYATLSFRVNATRTPGVVVDLEPRSGSKGRSTYAHVFEFTDAGGTVRRVTSSSSSRPPAHEVGAPVVVYYDPANPNRAHTAGFMANWFLPCLMGLFGIVFGGIGAAFLVSEIRRLRRRALMRRIGRRVRGEVSRTVMNKNLKIGGKHPWRLHVRWHDPITGKNHTFVSEDLFVDVNGLAGEAIDVLIDSDDPTRYWVDVSALEKSARLNRKAG
ncbi:DUF3592 domain-containing protein [Tahibacter amnicola]|uniref:DUF3592 domain-containing protein n=1 Tax=Tahibacter amnicola TaxID=2976241 RepID=A0ABY6BB57_9GAMM|nr:DUF3592 domain-containing protein [Tahibacter amnicola]UXI66380.1 DUF3592 domain-containing protein [Tahibacter amnicola]